MFLESFKEFKKLRSLTGLGMCLALGVILSFFFSVQLSQELKLTFSFLPLALIGMMYGPSCGFIAGAALDLICYVIKPTGPYFPGFTLTTALTGLVFGLFLYKGQTKLWRMAAAKVLINLLLNLLLNSLWLKLLYGSAFWAMLPTRLVKNAALLPIEIALLWLILVPVRKYLMKNE